MEAFLYSTLAVTLAEIGDKTQLLSLFLIARFKRPWPVLWGIIVATLLNHGVSAWLGHWMAGLLPAHWLPLIVGGSFILLGAWVLIPDKDDGADSRWLGMGAFTASFVLFFIAEIGDKTQVATVLLAARFDNLVAVIIGTTLGMVLANAPVIFGGQWLMQRVSLTWIRGLSAALFMLFGVLALLHGYR
ncbi:TMEM165/GDT1 family protein [Salinispirillum sp. LH 10-3-1]|uniref:GDT1 family protein n=1 Tax=Salinispirillum sp. LH 10-3-1 TaxID=2952525 RepID=A0AB38YIZ0_9GAMM